MKRFVETEKWNDPWFRRLPRDYKLLWDYLYTRCDNSGVWSVDWDLVKFHVGIDYNEAEALKIFGDRVKDIGRCRWWLPKFVEFQFGVMSEASRVHQSVITLMKKQGVYTLWIGYDGGIHTPKDRKRTGQEKDKDFGKESEENLSSADEMSQVRGAQPASLEEVKAAVMTVGIPDRFVEMVYETWAMRGAKDAVGSKVEIIPYLKKRWNRESTDWKNGTHRENQNGSRGGKHGPDRNSGTLNDSGDYAKKNLGKPTSVQSAKQV